MNPFNDKVAIITGGASGIGRAIGAELVRRGARVILADINGDEAETTAREMGDAARAARVDVVDADAVRRLVDEVIGAHGRLDFMFNNAGIALAGETRDMSLEEWDRIIDVNLRGVVHGIAAAYPVMIRQGFGHIVNTASAAGIGAVPGWTAYAATKHAVVGLSVSLRGEAAGFGVKVSVVCPGFIDTPIKHRMRLLNTDLETAMKNFRAKLHPPEKCARDLLHGVTRNRAIIVVTPEAKIAWRLYRLAPAAMIRAAQWAVERGPLLGRR